MKRSLPVVRGLSMALVAAVLTTACSLGLPGSDSNEDLTAGKRLPLPEAAPRVDPQDLDVDFVEPRSKDEKKRKAKKASKKKRNGSAERKGTSKNVGGDGGGNATTPRSAPKERGRNPGGPGDPAKPKPRKNRPPKEKSEPKDPPPVVVSDLTGDPQGEGQFPGYMDIESVRLQASGSSFIAELTFAQQLPSKMPDDQYAMLASIEVKRGNKKLSVYAEADARGWQAHTNRSAEFPGSLEIRGRTMRFTLARSFFGARFDWYAHSSWTKSTTTNTEYFFDFAPDDQKGRYPSDGTT